MAKHGIRNKRKQDLIFYIIMLAYPVLQFAVFYIGVNVNSILMAFQKYSGKGEHFEFLTGDLFRNFKDVFSTLKEKQFEYAFKNSLIAYAAGLFISTSVGIIFSYYIFKKFPLHGMMKVILFTPSIISGMVLVSIYMQFVEYVVPAVVEKLFHKEIQGLIANPSTKFGSVLFFCVWLGFGGSILLYVGAMNNISESVLEACKLDGANTIQEMIYIILPLIYPTFTTFIVVGVGGILTNQMALFSFFGTTAEAEIQTFGYYFFKRTYEHSGDRYDYPFLATMGLLMTLIIAPLTLLVKWLMEKFGPKLV